jgi:hypothetical protein
VTKKRIESDVARWRRNEPMIPSGANQLLKAASHGGEAMTRSTDNTGCRRGLNI